MANEEYVLDQSFAKLAEVIRIKRDAWSMQVDEFRAVRKAKGMSDEAIEAAIREDFESGGPLIGSLKSRVAQSFAGALEELSNEVVRTAYEDKFGEDIGEIKYMWVATLENSCPDCVDLHGTIKTMDEWDAEGGPNIAPTICTLRSVCHCNLLPVDRMTDEDRASIIEPVQIQRERIKEYVRARKEDGVRLSAAYKQALIGQANNPDSIVR